MAAPELVHLHVHSQYSMLDGAIRLKGLVERVKALGMGAVALTDHGNMFAAVQLHKTCKEVGGVKPILGCEVNLTPGDRRDASDRSARHLVLLAASDIGYRNLVQIVSRGWVDVPAVTSGPPLPPRIDFEVLRAHSAGLVGLSGCMAGHLAQEVLLRGEGAGRAALANLRDSFAPGHFFVELQDHGLPEQKPLAEILVQLARDLSLPLVATNDCHYLAREDAPAQLALQCIGSGRLLEEMERAHHGSHQMWVKTPEEMAERFADVPEALANTLRVAEMTAGQCSPFSKPKLPRFKTPDGSSEEDHLRALSRRRLDERFAEAAAFGRTVDQDAYRRRLEWELEVIVQMGFAGYFLIVQDFIVWAKERGIPVGPGRGSGAGSIVAWSLKITDLDPIPYGLLFERFLNPERVSMPDFDIDFCMDRRDEVIAYVRERYGHESVGQIATFHLLKSRSVVRDVGRVMKMTPQDAGAIASLVPEPVQGKSVPIATAMEQEPKLKQRYDEDPQIKTLLDTAMKLEDLARHAGMHAAGVVISEGPLWDHVPVFCPEPGALVTQYHKDDVEAAGLVKFDFLGLKTLTVIDVAQRLIRRRPGADGEFRVEAIPMDDKATFALLSSGETTNVFQLESSGMQSLFKQLKPDCFEDIVAAVALYRPGPLGSGMVEDFVQRKHGRIKVAYPHPCLEKILKETYGVIVYQEQVMQAAQEMAGYTLGGADLLRRAMGKKKAEEMAKQKATFVEGAVQKKYAAEDAQRVFELIDFFAGYGFNKCVIGDTRVVDARTGERTTVRALFDRRRERRGFTVHALGDDWKLRPRAVTDVVWNGRKPVFEILTAAGHRLTATDNHPFRTRAGWTMVRDLRIGDAVAAHGAAPRHASRAFDGSAALDVTTAEPERAGDVYWDHVVAIEPRGIADVFDLTVEQDHNFVAEGLVVHNSHSAAYALITYQTAYLKAHYPVEFICATLTADKDKIDKVVRTVAEARAMGITVLPPDVNESEIDFSVVYAKAPDESVKRKKDQPVSAGGKLRDPMHPQIRFGLGGVKGIGESALEAIFEVRKDEPFLEVFDFCDRVDLRRVNKAVVEALTQCGAFDTVHKALGVPGRAPAFAAIDAAIERGKKASADRASGQTSLFGLLDASPGGGAGAGPRKAVPLTAFPRAEPWDTRELLAREKTALGFYVSGHPLDRYASELRRFSNATTESCAAMQEGSKVVIGGSVEGYRERTTKTGRKIAFFSLEDPHGRVEVIVRPQALDKEEIVTVLNGGDPVLVTGTLQFEMDRGGAGGGGGGGAGGGEEGAMDAAPEPKIILEEVAPLAQSLRQKTKSVRVKLMVEKLRGNQLHELRATLAANPGPCPVSIEIGSTERWMVQMPTTGLSVEPSDALLSALEKLFGEKVCELR